MSPGSISGDASLGFEARRLRRRSDFQNAYRNGRRDSGRLVNVFTVANELSHFRFGITVTRKSGSAVVRNRLRRQIREILRETSSKLPENGRDFVVHVRPGIGTVRFATLGEEIGKLLTRASRSPLGARPR